MGTYDVTEGPFLNPIKTIVSGGPAGFSGNSDAYHDYMDTHNAGAGYIGEVAWVDENFIYQYVPSNIISDLYNNM
jgi:hypothetical protein